MKNKQYKNSKTISLEKVNELQKMYNNTYSELRCNETKLFNLKWQYNKDKKRYVIKKSFIHSFGIYFISLVSLSIIMSLFYNISLLSLCIFSSLICVSELFINLKKNISNYFDKFENKESSLFLNDEISELENYNYNLQHLCEVIYQELINVKNHIFSINNVINIDEKEKKILRNDNCGFVSQDEKYSKEKVLVLR